MKKKKLDGVGLMAKQGNEEKGNTIST